MEKKFNDMLQIVWQSKAKWKGSYYSIFAKNLEDLRDFLL